MHPALAIFFVKIVSCCILQQTITSNLLLCNITASVHLHTFYFPVCDTVEVTVDVQLYGTGLSVNVTVLSGAKSLRVIVRDSIQRRYTKKGEMYEIVKIQRFETLLGNTVRYD